MKDNANSQPIAVARTLTLLALILWFAAAFIGGLLGIVDTPGRPPLTLLCFIALPILGIGAAYRLNASFRAFTESIDLTLLVGSHVWRLVGVGFVIGWLEGALPAGFAIPEGFGDIIAALGALALVPKLRRGQASRGWLLAWNVFGFLDLVFAILLGISYSNSTLGFLSDGTVTTRAMVTFPVSLIPTFFVPLFILLHALTFKRIADMKSPTSQTDVHTLDSIRFAEASPTVLGSRPRRRTLV